MNDFFKTILGILATLSVFLAAFPVRADIDEDSPARNVQKSIQSSDDGEAKSPPQTVSETRASVGKVALLFKASRKEPVPEPSARPVVTAKEEKLPTATWLKKIGTIRDGNGTMRLYFKDQRTGAILRVRADGTIEDGFRLTVATEGKHIIETPEGIFYLQGDEAR